MLSYLVKTHTSISTEKKKKKVPTLSKILSTHTSASRDTDWTEVQKNPRMRAYGCVIV